MRKECSDIMAPTWLSLPLVPLLSYVLISTFTPGPSNLTSTSLALLHGYRQTLRYQVGLAVGVVLLMLLSGLLSAALFQVFPILQPLLRYIGAAYMLYLAYTIAQASYVFTVQRVKPLGFTHGLLLQLLNPKLWIYAFTLFSTFLVPLTTSVVMVSVAALVLAAISFVATSLWALFGNTLKAYLHMPAVRIGLNLVLALSLVYVALALLGVVA